VHDDIADGDLGNDDHADDDLVDDPQDAPKDAPCDEEFTMATEIELVVRELFASFDKMDFEAIRGQVTADAQGVDEISRRWLRSKDEIATYFAGLGQVVSEVKSDLKELHEVTWADSAVVTLWLEQSYLLDGQAQQVSAPTTIVLRREDGAWRILLIHSIPLPPED